MTFGKEQAPVTTSEVLGTVTKAEFNEAFASILERPSYQDIAVTEGQKPLAKAITDRYHSAVEATRDRIYEKPGLTQKQKEAADREFLNSLFGSSDGSESRMVALGYKPATFVGINYGEESMLEINKSTGGVALSELSCDAVFRLHEDINPDLRFTTNGVIEQRENYHAGFLYNVSSVESVVAHNADIFTAIGYDVTKPGEELAEEIFAAEDKFAHSLLLGYSLGSSVLFYLQNPNELNRWGDYDPVNVSDQAQRYIDNYWNNMERILNPEQLAIARTLAANPELLNDLEVRKRTDFKAWDSYSNANVPVQETWVNCGMAEYLDSIRNQLYDNKQTPNEFPHYTF